MPKRYEPPDDDDADELPEDLEDFTEEELEEYYDLVGDFPELDEMDMIADWDESDKYGGGEQ